MSKYFVYCLFNNGNIIYIGSSTKLLNRLKTHRKDKEFNKVVYCELPDQKTMLDFEIYSIDKVRPPLNRSVPKPKLKEKPQNLKWKKANLAFLNYDKVDISNNILFNASWDYTNYVCEYFGISNVDPYQQYLSYIKVEDKVAAVFDGSGLTLEELASSEGLISSDEFYEQYFLERDAIPVQIYEQSFKQFDN